MRRVVFHVVVSTIFHTFGQIVDTFRGVWEAEAAQLTHLVLIQINAQCPNAAVHRHQKNILSFPVAYEFKMVISTWTTATNTFVLTCDGHAGDSFIQMPM